MEIEPVPRRPPLSAGGRVVGVLAFLLPVTVLTLVPVMLGLDRYVVTSDAMDGTMGRGAIVFAQSVPVSDLEVGDVITFTPPGAPTGSRVTRRLVALEPGAARTKGDARAEPDPWRLTLDRPTQSRVVLGVPWVGYPLTGPVGRGIWTLLALGAGSALVVLAVRSMARRPTEGSPAGLGT